MRDDEPVIVNKRVVDVVEEMWVLRREVTRVDLIQTLLQVSIPVVVVHGYVAVAHKHRVTSAQHKHRATSAQHTNTGQQHNINTGQSPTLAQHKNDHAWGILTSSFGI